MHLIEIPPGGVLLPQRHLYEEKYWVVDGLGSTELSFADGSGKRDEPYSRSRVMSGASGFFMPTTW